MKNRLVRKQQATEGDSVACLTASEVVSCLFGKPGMVLGLVAC